MSRKALAVGLACAFVIILWFGSALVRVENERYALSIGMCQPFEHVLPDMTCIKKTQTRTGWWWHLYFALLDS